MTLLVSCCRVFTATSFVQPQHLKHYPKRNFDISGNIDSSASKKDLKPCFFQSGWRTSYGYSNTSPRLALAKDNNDFSPGNSFVVDDQKKRGKKKVVWAAEKAEDFNSDPAVSVLEEAPFGEQTTPDTVVMEEQAQVPYNVATAVPEIVNGVNGDSEGLSFLHVDDTQRVEDEVFMRIAIDLATEE
jgi:hypothetical protein